MNLKVALFCTLATSPSWQAWLFRYNSDLYKEFITELQKSRSCSDNRRVMEETLPKIEQAGGMGILLEWISSNYPHMLEDSTIKPKAAIKSSDPVFEYFNPNVVTYPRRKIFKGDANSLHKQVNEFVLDKIRYDSIIIKDTAYVEYLAESDRALLSKIPQSSWQIAQYRLKHAEK